MNAIRTKPPNRRASWTQKAVIGGQTFYLGFGEDSDGRLIEIFITASKEGSFTRGIMDALARMISVALQCQTPVSEVVKALKSLNFPYDGPVLGSPKVQTCTSVADWIAQEIQAVYPEGVAVLERSGT
jgi:ribonucleoside-diphosphate reductase alpha chain